MLKAVILDLDGTLVDSEQQGHRVAFNLAFEAFGLPDRWDPERYRQLLSVSGGERRLFGWLSSPDSSFSDRPEAERREMAGSLHRWKTQRFAELAAAGEIPAQPGAVRLVEQLESAGVTLAIATTGSRQLGRAAGRPVVRLGPLCHCGDGRGRAATEARPGGILGDAAPPRTRSTRGGGDRGFRQRVECRPGGRRRLPGGGQR